MIRLNNVSKVFTTPSGQVAAVDNVDLQVEPGTIYGVIGTSGAGKSTLIRCVNLLERPTSGEVWVNNQNLVNLSDAQLRKARQGIGMIFQHFNLLSNRTVFDNIALPLELAGQSKNQIEDAVLPLLELTGLSDKRYNYPSQLSGGQKQRVAIARALANKPAVLLCDEATSALDPQTTRSILQLLKDINKQLGITILMITHEMDVVQTICHRVAIMSFGKIIEENTVEQFFLNPQTELAKDFVRSAIHEKPVADIEHKFQQEPSEGARLVLRISFVGEKVDTPLVTSTARQFDIDLSILQADVETVNEKSMGFLMVELKGDAEKVNAALKHIQQQTQAEVIGYVN